MLVETMAKNVLHRRTRYLPQTRYECPKQLYDNSTVINTLLPMKNQVAINRYDHVASVQGLEHKFRVPSIPDECN